MLDRVFGTVLALLLGIGASAALAHVTLEQAEVAVGSYYKAVLRVTHGCEGSPTTAVSVEIPEGIISVKPMPKYGWEIEMTKGDYARSYPFHGRELKEGVKRIVWTGGPLPNDYYDEFVFAAYVAPELEPGQTLYFKVVQTCEEGGITWVEIPEEGFHKKLERPAAALRLLPPKDAHQAH